MLICYSPLLLFLLVAGIIPAFLGESHFAFLTYAKNFRQTPMRRQMDYLRQVGGSKEAAKELKLFNLSDYLTDRFTALSQTIYEENVALNRRRLFWGGLLAILGQLGYYAAYVLSIYRTIQGRYTHRRSHPDHHRHHAGDGQYSAGIFHRLGRCRPGAVPHRSAGVL